MQSRSFLGGSFGIENHYSGSVASTTAGNGGRMKGSKSRKKRLSKELKIKKESEEKMLQLQQQLMFLRWRKVQTGAKMRSILADSKRFRTMDETNLTGGEVKAEERAQWMQEIVESEMGRPLEVDDDYIQSYITESKNSTKRLQNDTECHLRNVQRLKETTLEGENLRMRVRRYKDKLSLARGVPRVRTPNSFVEAQERFTDAKLSKLDALERHLLSVKNQAHRAEKAKAGLFDEPSLTSSTDLFLLRVPQSIGGSQLL